MRGTEERFAGVEGEEGEKMGFRGPCFFEVNKGLVV